MAETKTFEYKWPEQGTAWYRNGSPEDARRFFWSEYQADLMSEIEKEIRNGWTPITELGPSAINMRTNKKTKIDIDPVGAVISLGLSAILDVLSPTKDIYYYPSVFRVLMRKD